MQGLIVENKANLYKIKLGDINYIATARGKFKNDSFTPVVGDIAEFSIVDENKKTAVSLNFTGFTTVFHFPTVKDGILPFTGS